MTLKILYFVALFVSFLCGVNDSAHPERLFSNSVSWFLGAFGFWAAFCRKWGSK